MDGPELHFVLTSPKLFSPPSVIHITTFAMYVVNISFYKRHMSVTNTHIKEQFFTALEPVPACNQNEQNDGFAGNISTQRVRE